ncbi:Cocaine esterase [Candidatus Rubidus massiliensis]|nr:Cocaine esterase [Candidatus Rubidus massiliensis]
MFKLLLIFTFAILLLALNYKGTLKNYFAAWYLQVPFPKYATQVLENIPIKMSDHILLSCDIYKPRANGPFPTILARTPYGKQNKEHYYSTIGNLFAGQGFAFVIQNVRGKDPSLGEFYPHKNDAQDGADTIDWIATQTWCNGNIALFGFSYLGTTSWQALSQTKHPIQTLAPWFSGSNPYFLWYNDGVVNLKQLAFWLCKYGMNQEKEIAHELVDHALSKDTNWDDLDQKISNQVIPAYKDFYTHTTYNEFWEKLSSSPLDAPDVPVLLASGWYDRFLKATIADFHALKQASPDSKKYQSCLILGPWTHNPTQKIKGLNDSKKGDFFKQFSILIEWYKKWMRLESNLNVSPVSYYIMGLNIWKQADHWPPNDVQKKALFLTKQGTLSTFSSSGKVPLIFNPNQFIPTFGGRMLYGNGIEGPQDQSYLRLRKDVLFFKTEPFKEAITIVGPPKLSLIFGKIPATFDLSCKIVASSPSGEKKLISDSYQRFEDIDSSLPTPIIFNDTAYHLPKDYALELIITHSDFPSYEPNKELLWEEKAEIEIITGTEKGSKLELLLLP